MIHLPPFYVLTNKASDSLFDGWSIPATITHNGDIWTCVMSPTPKGRVATTYKINGKKTTRKAAKAALMSEETTP